MFKQLLKYYTLYQAHKKYQKLFLDECSKSNININLALSYISVVNKIEKLWVK